MQSWQFVITTLLAALVLAAAVWLITALESNRSLEKEIQGKAMQVQNAQQLAMVRNNLLQVMGQVSVQNPKMRALLERHGVTVNVQNPPQQPAAPKKEAK